MVYLIAEFFLHGPTKLAIQLPISSLVSTNPDSLTQSHPHPLFLQRGNLHDALSAINVDLFNWQDFCDSKESPKI